MKTKTVDAEEATLTWPNLEAKKAETRLRNPGLTSKMAAPSASALLERAEGSAAAGGGRGGYSHAPFPGIGCAPAGPGTHRSKALRVLSLSSFPSWAAGDYLRQRRYCPRQSSLSPAESPTWARPGCHRSCPGRQDGRGGLVSESAPSALLRFVPVPGKTGFSTSFSTLQSVSAL